MISTDADHVMPPASTGKKLTEKQVQVLRDWIQQGAEWEGHWSFIRPELPEVPEVSDPAWKSNPIDAFVLKRLDTAGLPHSPPADKVTLIRRATLDLTGLPPTPAEIDAFQADESPRHLKRCLIDCCRRIAMANTWQGIGWTLSVTGILMACIWITSEHSGSIATG